MKKIIFVLSLPIKVLDCENNLATGEIKKFNFIESQKNKFKYNEQIVLCNDYDEIWRHISDDYFKQVGKFYTMQ